VSITMGGVIGSVTCVIGAAVARLEGRDGNKSKGRVGEAPVPDVCVRDFDGNIISLDSLHIEERIGDGGFCTIHRARYKRDNHTLVAVKILKEQHSESAKILHSFAKEICIHSQVRHPHVLFVFGGSVKPGKMCLVTELMETSLRTAMDVQPVAFTPQIEVDIARTIALGLNHLHSLKILHRDVKSANVLLDSKWLPKLADFGLARIKEASADSMTMGIGTPAYMAPEMFTSSKYTSAVDWFAFGMVIWELITKDHPFKRRPFYEYLRHGHRKAETSRDPTPRTGRTCRPHARPVEP
jgi:serine/threonine protein kinase